MPKIGEHAKNIPADAEEKHKIMEILCFSPVRQCDIGQQCCACTTSFLNLFINYYISSMCFLAGQKIMRIYASGWFVRMENNNCTPNTNNYV